MNAKRCLALAFFLMVSEAQAQAIPAFPRGAESTEARLLAKVGPQTRASIKQEAARQTLDAPTATRVVQANAAGPNLTAGDIEILNYLVLMEAARSGREDAKAIMDGLKRIDDARGRLRPATNAPAVKSSASRQPTSAGRSTMRPFPLPEAELEVKIERAHNDLDSSSEMGEMESLRLQMCMDRLSKMMSTLSNLLKKMSDSQAALTQDLK